MFYQSGKFLKVPNKYWEVQSGRWDDWTSYFDITCNWTRKCDHAGFTLNLELVGFYFSMMVYDNRHWNHNTNDYAVYDQAGNVVE